MVGNMTSIFTQVCIAKVTPIYSFLPHLLHTVPFTYLFLLLANVGIFMIESVKAANENFCSVHRPNVQWGFSLPFSWWKSSNQSHCNLKLKVKMRLLLFALPCWSLATQNVGIHYAGVHKIPEDILPCLDWEAANIIFHVHLIMNINSTHYPLYSQMFCGWFTCMTSQPNLLSVWTTFLGLISYWQVWLFHCLAKQWTPSLSCHPGLIFRQ